MNCKVGGGHVRLKTFGHILLGITLALLLSGCTKAIIDVEMVPPDTHPKDPNEGAIQDTPIPLDIHHGVFEKVYGWLDNETVLYSYEMNGKYYVRSHHLFSGVSELIFQFRCTNHPSSHPQ